MDMKGKDGVKSVVVIGELNVDFIISGEEILPEFNREKMVHSFDQVLGSSSAITACVLSGLGVNVIFAGVVGDDAFGEYCIEKLKTADVDTSFIRKLPEHQTGVTLSFSTSKDRALLTYPGAISAMTPDQLPDDLLEKATHIHFGSYYLQKGMQPYWASLFADAKSRHISTSFDTGWDPDEKWERESISQLLKHTDLFMPSKEEFQQIFGDIKGNLDLPQSRGGIAVKCGAEGSCFLLDNRVEEVPGFPIHPIDTTGAGDSFNAGLIYGYLHGKREKELLSFANACGALATLRVGGAEDVPDLNEVESFLLKSNG